MGRYYLKDQILARWKKVSIGIDVHKESWQVTVISEGEELFHSRIPGDYSALRKLLNRFIDCQIRVAYEAGPCGFGLYDRLRADEIDVLAVSPSLIPVESGNKVKTDLPVPGRQVVGTAVSWPGCWRAIYLSGSMCPQNRSEPIGSY